MPIYSCCICLKEFYNKTAYDRHIHKKNPCKIHSSIDKDSLILTLFKKNAQIVDKMKNKDATEISLKHKISELEKELKLNKKLVTTYKSQYEQIFKKINQKYEYENVQLNSILPVLKQKIEVWIKEGKTKIDTDFFYHMTLPKKFISDEDLLEIMKKDFVSCIKELTKVLYFNLKLPGNIVWMISNSRNKESGIIQKDIFELKFKRVHIDNIQTFYDQMVDIVSIRLKDIDESLKNNIQKHNEITLNEFSLNGLRKSHKSAIVKVAIENKGIVETVWKNFGVNKMDYFKPKNLN